MNLHSPSLPLLLTSASLLLSSPLPAADTSPATPPEKHPQPPQVETVNPLGFIPHLEQKLGRRLEPTEKPAVSKAINRYSETCRTAFVKFSGAVHDALDLKEPKNALRPARPALAIHPGTDDSNFTEHLVPRLEAMLGRRLKGSEENRVRKVFQTYQADIAKARQQLAADLATATGLSAADAQAIANDGTLRPGPRPGRLTHL